MNYRQELKKLFDLQKFGMKFGLDNMRGLLRALGNPEAGLRMVHLAGTNGKGSTAAILAAILETAGLRVGVYTSPHLITFRERIQINEEMISEGEVLELSRRVWAVCDPESLPTFFEFVTAMAFLYFEERQVDVAVIEAGLGGRLDSTNVISPLASAITNISLEHTEHLGDSIEAIAGEKAGIIKPGTPVYCGPLPPEALAVIKAAATRANAPLAAEGRDFQVGLIGADEAGRPRFNYRGADGRVMENLVCGLLGPHQAHNAGLAVSLALDPVIGLAGRGWTVNEGHIRQGLMNATWPGRLEMFAPGAWPAAPPLAKAPLLLDGAHNPDGARTLAAALAARPCKKLHLILGIMADKDIAGILGPVIKLADQLYLTRPEFYRAAPPELLRDKLTAAFGPITVPHALYKTLPEAIRAAADQAGPDDLVVVSGSLFTVGEARACLLGIEEVESN